MSTKPNWVLPVIGDIIEFAETHGYDELSHDLKLVITKHFKQLPCEKRKFHENVVDFQARRG